MYIKNTNWNVESKLEYSGPPTLSSFIYQCHTASIIIVGPKESSNRGDGVTDLEGI